MVLDLRDGGGSRPMQLVAIPHTAKDFGMADGEYRRCPHASVVVHAALSPLTIIDPPDYSLSVTLATELRATQVRPLHISANLRFHCSGDAAAQRSEDTRFSAVAPATSISLTSFCAIASAKELKSLTTSKNEFGPPTTFCW